MEIEAEEDSRLNEIDYYRLAASLKDRTGEPLPTHDTFTDHMPKVFAAWQAARWFYRFEGKKGVSEG